MRDEEKAESSAGGDDSCPRPSSNPQSDLPSVTITLNKKTMLAVLNFQLKKTVLVCIVAGIPFALLGSLLFAFDYRPLVFPIIFLVCGVLLFVPLPVLYLLLRMATVKSKALKLNAVTTLYFDEKVTGYEKSDFSEVKDFVFEWAIFNKAMENPEYFFLFFLDSAFIIKKTDLKNCITDEFRDLIRSKLGNRFQEKKKDKKI